MAKKKTVKKKAAGAAAVTETRAPSKRKRARKKAKRAKAKPKPLGKCFVVMPFREPFNIYYGEIIRPAVVAAKLEPRRGDSLFTPTPIMADIWQMVQEASVLVAELTGKNPNVFYELGLAHAIGKPIVLISETMEDVPFDLRPLRVISYDKDDPTWGPKLKVKLKRALIETMAKPAKAVPPMFVKKVKSQAPEESELSVRLRQLERRVASLGGQRGLVAEIEGIPHGSTRYSPMQRNSLAIQ